MNHRWNAPRLSAVAFLFCAAMASIHAQAVDAPIDWQQPAQPLGGALTALAVRTGLIVGVDAAAVRGKQAPALQGRYTPHEALQRLLAGSGLQAVRDPNGSYALRSAVPAPAPPPYPRAQRWARSRSTPRATPSPKAAAPTPPTRRSPAPRGCR